MALFDVVQPAAREQNISVRDASAIGRDIAANGKALLYAILFDFDSDVIKPASKPQLDEPAAYLRKSPVNVYVVSQTDDKGRVDCNGAPSQRRARAFVEALTKERGVAA